MLQAMPHNPERTHASGFRMKATAQREIRTSRSDLGFASMLLACGWTVAAVAAATQMAPSRGRSLLTFAVLACLVGTTGCTMLALAFFPSFTQRLRVVGWLTVAAASLLAVATICSVWQLPPEQLQWFDNPGDARDTSGRAVDWSLVMLTCSICLIATRLLSNQASRVRFSPHGAVQSIFLLFWRQHRLVGWMALALSAAHSVYFLRYPRSFEEQWTGIASFGLLGLLGAVGLITSYRRKPMLLVHRGIAAVLAVILTLHWPPLLYVEAAALLILVLTALVNLKLAVLITRSVLGPSDSSTL
jgi:hypothetical protein